MATEEELQTIIRQLQEKIVSLSAEIELLRSQLDIRVNVPQFSLVGVLK